MEELTPSKIKFPSDEFEPRLAPGRSLIREVEKLTEAVLMLCELQRELSAKLDAALRNPINGVCRERQSSALGS